VFDASNDGVMAYQLGDNLNPPQLRWFDRSGKQLGGIGEAGFQNAPVLSPDGRKLLIARVASFGSYCDLWVYDLTRGVGTQITFDDNDHAGGMWTHDGTRILFTESQPHSVIYQAQADLGGVGKKQLILDTGVDIWPTGLSPDGSILLYGQGQGPEQAGSRLWVYPMSGNVPPYRLLEGEAEENEARFSPDGRQVAYISNESGRNEVYVVPFSSSTSNRTATGSRKLQISTSGGRRPNWRRDGKELFYVANDGALMSVSVTRKGSKFEFGAARPLFRPNSATFDFIYDVSPDGSRFIGNTVAPPETTAPITLVENWLSDFKK
jgi:Tol biopolymer transport system component